MKTVAERSYIDMSVQDTPPQKKKIKLKVFDKEVASPGNRSDISSSSCDSVDPIELPQFTPTVKCALMDGDCNSTIWNMVSLYQTCMVCCLFFLPFSALDFVNACILQYASCMDNMLRSFLYHLVDFVNAHYSVLDNMLRSFI